jgi:glycosyltransferase involved in cell wall biosynthesis
MPPVKVAWLQPSLQAYRIPVLTRLADDPRVDVTFFTRREDAGGSHRYGDIVLGTGVDVQGVASWDVSRGRPRTLFQGGIFKILFGGYDVVVLVDNIHNLTNWLFWLVSFFGGPHLMFFGYGTRPAVLAEGLSGRLRALLQRLLLKRGSSFAVYTAAGRNALISMGLDEERVFVLLNTLDTSYLTSLRPLEPRATLERGIPLRPGRPLLLFVGRMQAAKRLDVLIDSVRHLEDAGTSVDLVLIGDGPELTACRTRARGLEGVHFVPQDYDPRELAPYFAAADVLAIPGRVGLTCVHAFAYGLPCVTVAPGEVEQSPEFEYIEHGINGVVVPAPDPVGYARAVRALVEDPSRLTKMREACHASADRLSMEHMATVWVDAVMKAADRG